MFIPFILSKIPHCFFRMNSFENPLQSPRLPRLAGCLQQAKPRFPSLGFLRGDFQLFDGMVSAFKQKNPLGKCSGHLHRGNGADRFADRKTRQD
jgi:hypothetical protein